MYVVVLSNVKKIYMKVLKLQAVETVVTERTVTERIEKVTTERTVTHKSVPVVKKKFSFGKIISFIWAIIPIEKLKVLIGLQ